MTTAFSVVFCLFSLFTIIHHSYCCQISQAKFWWPSKHLSPTHNWLQKKSLPSVAYHSKLSNPDQNIFPFLFAACPLHPYSSLNKLVCYYSLHSHINSHLTLFPLLRIHFSTIKIKRLEEQPQFYHLLPENMHFNWVLNSLISQRGVMISCLELWGLESNIYSRTGT